MASIFKNPSHRANLGYNGFDMSHKKLFSSTTGELLPVYYDLLQPGDKVTLNTILKTRTMELASSAFATINEHLEWFFVPMTQIYSAFGDFYYQISDLKTSLMNRQLIDGRLPFIPSSNFLKDVLDETSVDMFGYQSQARIIDWFFPWTDSSNKEGVLEVSIPTGICPIFACAYQKIWMDFYRDTDRLWNDPRVYNLDAFYQNSAIDIPDQYEYFQLRYRPRRKDKFSNIFVSPMLGAGGVGSFNETENSIMSSFRQWLVRTSMYGLQSTFPSDPFGNESKPTNVTYPQDPTSLTTQLPVGTATSVTAFNQALNNVSNALSPSSIRTSFAIQKLMEITRRAGKHYDKQTLAHFGVDVPTGISGEVMYLGGNDSVINIGDVIATATGSANGSTSVLGQVGGKGYGYSNGKDIRFTAPCHGILMCLYSCDVETNYSNGFVDRLNTLMNREDWFSPEYDDLGMQPLFYYESPAYNPDAATANLYRPFGWQYRYSELKTKVNQCFGALSQFGSLSYWTNHFNNAGVTSTGLSDVSNFYVSPNELDDFMLVGYNTGLDEPLKPYDRDPLIHELYFDVKKASKMSTYGLEQL